MLVNRGWVPMSHLDPERRRRLHADAMPTDRVRLLGMLRRPQYYRPSAFTRTFLPDAHVKQPDPSYTHPNPHWLWLDMPSMHNWLQSVNGPADTLRFVNDFFVEEVLDTTAQDQVSREMMAWHQDGQRLDEANATLPTVLASVKAIQTDPRMFYGKPIISPPSINVPNKHLEYIYTWFSLGTFLTIMILLSRRRRVGANTSRLQSVK
jgi:cytochrome oxidase assembly protein ShyY1